MLQLTRPILMVVDLADDKAKVLKTVLCPVVGMNEDEKGDPEPIVLVEGQLLYPDQTMDYLSQKYPASLAAACFCEEGQQESEATSITLSELMSRLRQENIDNGDGPTDGDPDPTGVREP